MCCCRAVGMWKTSSRFPRDVGMWETFSLFSIFPYPVISTDILLFFCSLSAHDHTFPHMLSRIRGGDSPEHIPGRFVLQRLVQPFRVVEPKVGVQLPHRFPHRRIFLQVYFFILYASPQPLHENVVVRPAFSIPTDADFRVSESSRESIARKLYSLIAVEYLRLRDEERPIQGAQTELRLQTRGYLPGQYITAKQVHDRHEVHKSFVHPNIGDVGCPDLVWPRNQQSPQQIRIDRLSGNPSAQPWLGVNGHEPHQPQQASHPLRIHPISLALKPAGHPFHSVKGMPGILFIHEPHQMLIIGGFSLRLVIVPGPRKPHQRTLPTHRNLRVHLLNTTSLLLNGAVQIFF